jgi:hypothetical protein
MSKQYIGAKLLKKIYIAEKQERILIFNKLSLCSHAFLLPLRRK